MNQMSDVWQDVFMQKRRQLENANGDKFFGVADVGQFQTSLEAICRAYSRKNFTKIIARIYPSIDHVRSFTQAITACTQASGIASLVWGAGLILLEVCLCPFLPTRVAGDA